MTGDQWLELLGKLSAGTVGTVFGIIIWLGHKQVWVWGHQLLEVKAALREMKVERDQWRDQALKAANIALNVTAEKRS